MQVIIVLVLTGNGHKEGFCPKVLVFDRKVRKNASHHFVLCFAFQAGIGSPENPGHVLIALEPEAASIYCRKLKRNQVHY